ncbi:MAG: 1,4-alpha-glucan-branching enzyme, partial [Bacteroidota bacterium]
MVADKKVPVLVQNDPWLAPYQKEIADRIKRFDAQYSDIVKQHGSLKQYASAYNYLGLNYDPVKKGWWYREWAPEAE